MPWRSGTVMDSRLEFIRLAELGELSMTELCRRFGISRQTGYLYLRRYRQAGPDGLVSRSSRPHHPLRREPQMRPGKLVFAVLLGMAALVGGAFLAGWLIIALLHVQVPLAWNTWWSYVHAIGLPQVAPYVTKIKLASSIGFGVPLLAWLGVLYRMFRTPERSLYGEARFARGGDLARQDALKNDPSGILAGRFGGRFIRVGKSKHLLLASPTRSGKGVGVVIPNCLAWASSLVMLDVKQEAYEKSAGWRATLGPSYLFDPFYESRRAAR